MKKRYEYACDICDERVIVLESKDHIDFCQMAGHAMNLGWQHAKTDDGDILICPDCSEEINPSYASPVVNNTGSFKKVSARMGPASVISLLLVISFSLIALWAYDKTSKPSGIEIAAIESPKLDIESEDIERFHFEADETADVDPDIISKIEQNPEAYAEKIEAIVLDEESYAEIDRGTLAEHLRPKNALEPELTLAKVTEGKLSENTTDEDSFTVVKAKIKGSLNQTLLKSDLDQKQALALSKVFAEKVNLKKDLTAEDTVSLVFIDDSNKKNIKAVKLTSKGKTYHAIKDKTEDKFKLTKKGSEDILTLFDKSLSSGIKPDNLPKPAAEEKSADKAQQAETPEPLIHGKYAYFTGEINNTFSTAAEDVGLGFSHVKRLMHIFSYSVDFRRFAKGDKFSVIFEKNDFEKNTRKANIVAAEFIVRGKKHQRIRYKDKDGKTAYYMLNSNGPTKTVYKTEGGSSGKGFLRYPLKFKRISSHYNLRRRHPISGKIRPHKGTDFAAPRGTPVKSTGAGTVSYSGWQRGYGRVVKIKHSGNKYETVYAHLSKINRKAKKGRKVKRGQVIGYVGSTGFSTGNHLHYEFRVRGRAVNPLKVKLPKAGKVIATKVKDPKEFKRFKKHASLMKTELDHARKKNQLLASAKGK